MATAPKSGSVLLLLGETIPEHDDIRVGSFCEGDWLQTMGDYSEYAKYGAWMIWNDCSDWFFVGAYEPLGWCPMPDRDGVSGMRVISESVIECAR